MANSFYVYKYKDTGVDLTNLPANTHLIIELDTNNFYLVKTSTQIELYLKTISSGAETQIDVDPSDSSGDNKSRDYKIQSAFHDKTNKTIWFIDCENDGTDTTFDVWKLDYTNGYLTPTVTEVDTSSALTKVYSMDIFIIAGNTYAIVEDAGTTRVFDVDTSPFVAKDTISLPYGFFGGGGFASASNIIDYINMSVLTGNAIDKGDLSTNRWNHGSCQGATYGFFGGGSNVAIDYIDITTTVGNGIDKGDLTVWRWGLAGVSGPTYGFFGGGSDVGGYSNVIDYINVTTTTGNATDTGNLTVGREEIAGGVQGATYGFYGGGWTGAYRDIIDYIDITSTTQNATDTGNLTLSRRGMAGVSGSSYGFYGGGVDGGGNKNIIDYIDVTSTTQNALDKGDLTVSRRTFGSTSGPTYGFFGGGNPHDIIDYIDITTTTGNATDVGDLTLSREHLAGVG